MNLAHRPGSPGESPGHVTGTSCGWAEDGPRPRTGSPGRASATRGRGLRFPGLRGWQGLTRHPPSAWAGPYREPPPGARPPRPRHGSSSMPHYCLPLFSKIIFNGKNHLKYGIVFKKIVIIFPFLFLLPSCYPRDGLGRYCEIN